MRLPGLDTGQYFSALQLPARTMARLNGQRKRDSGDRVQVQPPAKRLRLSLQVSSSDSPSSSSPSSTSNSSSSESSSESESTSDSESSSNSESSSDSESASENASPSKEPSQPPPTTATAVAAAAAAAAENVDDDDYGEEHPPSSVVQYTVNNPPTGRLRWYWTQRYRLFSRYGHGIWMTPNAWFEVTPEAVATYSPPPPLARLPVTEAVHPCRKIANHMFPSSPVAASQRGVVVVDAFCGVGGSSIQFALSPAVARVVAVDWSADAIACARHNAAVYGVAHKIEFVCADFFALVDERWGSGVTGSGLHEITAVFVSPPWGGPSYRDYSVFDLHTMKPYNLRCIFDKARVVSPNIALYLPRTSDLNQLAGLTGDDEEMEVVHYCLGGRSKVGSPNSPRQWTDTERADVTASRQLRRTSGS